MERGKGGWGPRMVKVVPTNRSPQVRNLQGFGFAEYECPIGRAHSAPMVSFTPSPH